MTVEQLILKLLLRPAIWANFAKNQSEFLAITVTCSKRRKNRAFKVRLVLFSFSLVEKLARSGAITIAENCSVPQFGSSRWSERSGFSYSSIDLLSHAAIDDCTISLLCAQYHSLNKKYLVISVDADKSNLRVTRDLHDILQGTSRQRVSWDFICARWTLCLKSRLLLDHRSQGRSRQTHEGELSGIHLVIYMVKLGWWGGHSTCLYWWSQCLSELFLDAPFPWHWQFTLRRQK